MRCALARESLRCSADDRRTHDGDSNAPGRGARHAARAVARGPVGDHGGFAAPTSADARAARGDTRTSTSRATLADASARLDTRRRACSSGPRRLRRTVASHRRDLEPSVRCARSTSRRAAERSQKRLLALEADAHERMAEGDGIRLPARPATPALSIGYRVTDGTLDPSCYDLLASEARLASFVAIAKGDVPTRHWFRLGRPVTPVGTAPALISWSGSMFEYLMPSLVMRAPAGSLLEQTSRLIVRRQISYGAELGLPWGISESAYNARDLELTYQYSNFGVPGLGLEARPRRRTPWSRRTPRRLPPWSTREPAARNFARLARAGGARPLRLLRGTRLHAGALPEGSDVAIVRAFMAHHQGMTIVAIANALLHGMMRSALSRRAQVQAAELLLQERTPRDVAVAHPRAEEVQTRRAHPRARPAGRASLRTPPHDAHRQHASALQRPLRGDDHGGGLRLQPLA